MRSATRFHLVLTCVPLYDFEALVTIDSTRSLATNLWEDVVEAEELPHPNHAVSDGFFNLAADTKTNTHVTMERD